MEEGRGKGGARKKLGMLQKEAVGGAVTAETRVGERDLV